MPQNWIRLNREQSHDVLSKLSSDPDAVVFSKETTEVCYQDLPFYKNFKLLRLANYATMPVFTLVYLSDGTDFLAIDGTPNPIYTANEKDPIHITATNAIAYLDFFFSHVQGSEGDIFIIKDPQKMAQMDALSESQQSSLLNTFRPLKSWEDTAEQKTKVSGTIYYGGGLIAATIGILPDGKLSFEDQSLLLTGVYFPHNPYTTSWLEE